MKTLLSVLLTSVLGATSVFAGLTAYDNKIAADNAGSLPYLAISDITLIFDTTNSAAFDFGAVSASSTIEFIVSGDPLATGSNGWLAVGANSTWSVRYEQWNNTGELGFTHAGVADYGFLPPPDPSLPSLESPTELTHVTFRWDQANTRMELFLDGIHVGSNSTASGFEMPSGSGWLGNTAGLTEGMLGVIERVTVYDDAIPSSDILAHAKAWLEPDKIELTVTSDGTNLTFTWPSSFGKIYDLLSDTSLSADPATWPVFDGRQDMTAIPPENTLVVPIPGDSGRFFVLVEKDAPPVFSDDFESGQGAWTLGSDGAPGTTWAIGAPTDVGPPAASSGISCFGTNLGSNYAIDANIWLRSPAIDLTDGEITRATIKFRHFRDIEEGFDFGSVRVLDATTDLPLGADIAGSIDGVGTSWETFSAALPPEALGQMIRIEYRFESDNLNNLAGWYIDDVEVSVK